MKRATFELVLLLLGFMCIFVIGFVIGKFSSYTRAVGEIRKVVYDTIAIYQPVPRDSVVLRYKTVPVKKAAQTTTKQPTLSNSLASNIITIHDEGTDSTQVTIPITQKVYSDSTYTAYVSGYDVSLDSIFIREKTVEVTKFIEKKRSRFSIGIQVGYGVTPKGPQPFIGIGGQFRLTR